MPDPLIKTEAFLGADSTVVFRTEVRASPDHEWVSWQTVFIPCRDEAHALAVVRAYQVNEILEEK